MQGFIAAGLGVTLLPDLALPTLRSDLVVRATDPPAPERRVWAATRAEGARSPATGEMLDDPGRGRSGFWSSTAPSSGSPPEAAAPATIRVTGLDDP